MVHVFEFSSWYIDGDLDWFCSNQYLIVTDDGIEFLERECQRDEDNMRKRFKDRIEHDAEISVSRKIDEYSKTDKLKEEYPEIWEKIKCYFSQSV